MQLYNTLTRQKEEFVPIGDEVTMYVCGLTVYDDMHIGHALGTITFEVLHRYLEWRGYKVKRIQNFTDVDDKIITRAAREDRSSEELSQSYIDAFFDDMAGLNVKLATEYPRATQTMDQIIAVISDLIEKGYAYESEGSVYFDVRKDKTYGELSGRSLDDMLQGTRFDPEPGKIFPADFALWKLSKEGDPAWESPWSQGRPGWHIECSAMAYEHLGNVIDIHGGGLDLVFPHHENEISQSKAFTSEDTFARFWMHNGMLRLSGEKMSKSIGNIVRVHDVLDEHSSDAFRLWIYTSHYRSPLLYDQHGLEVAERAARRIRTALTAHEATSDYAPLAPDEYESRFIATMDDDMNIPQAMAVVFDLVRDINRNADAGVGVSDAQDKLRELASVLGLTLEEPASEGGDLDESVIQELIDQRTESRASRDFAAADKFRDELQAMGVTITDSPDGTTWSRTQAEA